MRRSLDVDGLLLDESVEPGGVDGVLLKFLGFQKLNEVLDGRADLAPNLDLLEGEDEGLAGGLAVGTLGEQVTELGIGELVDAAVGADAEVSPAVGGGLELDPLDGARSRLEALVGVLGGDTRRNHMGIDVAVVLLEEVDGRSAVDVLPAVELANFGDVVQRDAHGDLKLRGGHVRAGDALRDGMLHLKTGIQLEEVVLVGVGVEQVLDGAGSLVADALRQALRGAFHLPEGVPGDDGRGALLEDLLEPTLRGAVAAVERDGVAVRVSDDLHLDVSSVLTELHDEDGTAHDLVLDLDVIRTEILLVVDEADALASASLGRLDHDAVLVPDLLGRLDGLLDVPAGGLLEGLLGDGTLLGQLGLERAVVGAAVRSRPGDRGDLGRLGQDVGGDLISQNAHHRTGRADELDAHVIESVGQHRVLRSVSPPGPDGIDAVLLRELDNHVDIGVVVQVLAPGHLHERIGQTDELGVRLEVLGRGHGHELDGPFVAELHVGPLPHGKDGLGRGHAVVRDEDLPDDAVSSAALHVLLQGVGGGGRLDGRHGQGGGIRGGRGPEGLLLQTREGGRARNER
mmetsp:Transcript_45652/g.84712  ORF Transcript_45652/g.84712 Transcript_45652/m.84712 type:complete len:571 (+) Transcript_45652:813-2525(+)